MKYVESTGVQDSLTLSDRLSCFPYILSSRTIPPFHKSLEPVTLDGCFSFVDVKSQNNRFYLCLQERRGSVMVSTVAWHAGDLGSILGQGMLSFRCKNLSLNIRNCVSLCLSDEILKAVGPFYLVSKPGEVKQSHTGVKCVTFCGVQILA